MKNKILVTIIIFLVVILFLLLILVLGQKQTTPVNESFVPVQEQTLQSIDQTTQGQNQEDLRKYFRANFPEEEVPVKHAGWGIQKFHSQVEGEGEYTVFVFPEEDLVYVMSEIPSSSEKEKLLRAFVEQVIVERTVGSVLRKAEYNEQQENLSYEVKIEDTGEEKVGLATFDNKKVFLAQIKYSQDDKPKTEEFLNSFQLIK